MRTAFIASSMAALAVLLAAAAGAQTPAERGKDVVAGLQGIQDDLIYDYWLATTIGDKKLGYGRVKVEKGEDANGQPAYVLQFVNVIQTREGKVSIVEKAVLSPGFRLSDRTWGLSGKVHGFDESKEKARFTFTWGDKDLTVHKEGGNQSTFSISGHTISEVRFLYPLLAKKGAARYSFSTVIVDEDEVKRISDKEIEVLAPAEIDVGGESRQALEVKDGSESMFFAPDGSFLKRTDGPLTMLRAASEEDARKGLAAFDENGTVDWTRAEKPAEVMRGFAYAMIKQDAAALDKVVHWKRFLKAIFEAQGQPVDDAMLEQMVAAYKPRLVQQMLSGGKNMKAYHLLVMTHAVTVSEETETKAVLTLMGQQQKFSVEKIDGQWMVVSIGM